MSQTPSESEPVDRHPSVEDEQLDGTMAEPASAEREPTGNADVDRVVASLDGLDELPIGEHVALFEQAHESLRRTLNQANAPRPQG